MQDYIVNTNMIKDMPNEQYKNFDFNINDRFGMAPRQSPWSEV